MEREKRGEMLPRNFGKNNPLVSCFSLRLRKRGRGKTKGGLGNFSASRPPPSSSFLLLSTHELRWRRRQSTTYLSPPPHTLLLLLSFFFVSSFFLHFLPLLCPRRKRERKGRGRKGVNLPQGIFFSFPLAHVHETQ